LSEAERVAQGRFPQAARNAADAACAHMLAQGKR
jgi:hypothetical protein